MVLYGTFFDKYRNKGGEQQQNHQKKLKTQRKQPPLISSLPDYSLKPLCLLDAATQLDIISLDGL